MNQRSTFSRTKEPRREKIIRTRRDDGDRAHGDEPPTRRSSSERPNSTHVSSYSRYKDSYSEKSRSNSRDSQGSLIFRRQERNKVQSNFSKSSSGEISPGRVSHADTMRNETPGRLNYISHYNRGFNTRDRDYTSKRSGLIDNNQIVDEARLKSYLHRLLRDEDKERQASLIRQLKAVFEYPENYKVIFSNKDVIISTFEDFVQLGLNVELKHEFVCAIGALGATLGNKAKSLLDWEFNIISTSKCEDLRILMLKTQLEMLKLDSEKQSLSELIPFVMSRLQSTLENADVPDLLIAIVNVIFEISSGYPGIFSKHFRDTVDILIGWHIDATQQHSVIKFTSSALIGFQQFWISDINFTVTLLGQFLEDMESYAEGLPKIKSPSKKSVMYLKKIHWCDFNTEELAQSKLNSTENSEVSSCSPEAKIAKIKSLIRVLITVLKSIENLIMPEENGAITWRFVIEMLKNFLKYVTITVAYNYYCDLMTPANECLDLILKLAQSHSKDALDELMSYIDLLQSRSSSFYESHLISILKVMIRFVKSVGTYLPVKFVTKLFALPSLTRQLRLSPSSSIQKLLMELYHVVLAVKNVQIVEEFYKCILADIMEAHSLLLKPASEGSGDLAEIKNAEASLMLSICTLVEIGNVKHSLIRMFALKPSFFDLMISQLKPTAPEFARRYPALQSSILYILYSHSQRHTHFVNSSVLINPNAASGSPISTSGQNSPIMIDIPPPSPSSPNLGKVIKILIDLLEGQYHSYDSRLLAAKWTNEILDSIQRHIPRLMQNSQFIDLLGAVINAGLSSDIPICKACCKSLHLFLKSAASVLPPSTLQRCYDLCVIRLSSHDPELQDQFANLIPLLPLDIILTANSLNVSKGGYLLSGTKDIEVTSKGCSSIFDIWTLYRGYMSRSYSGNFFNHHFRAITNFVLLGKEPHEKKWLLRLFHSCPPPERFNKVDSMFGQLVNSSNAALWFWAVWEVAQFCVSYKLRTPLGKPQETFMAIEAALKGAAKITKNNDDSFLSESRYTTLFRVNLLLSLMEHLEKLMYNAFEGCAVAFPSPPKVVRTFFRTNKSTCHEWLSRVRSTAVTVSLNAGCYAAAVRHGFELLQELKNSGNTQGPEFENALYSVVKALVFMHCPDAVLGLYLWCKDKVGRKFTWIKASVDCAAGRFENAADEYLCILHSLSECLSPQKKNKQNSDVQISEESTDTADELNTQLNKSDSSNLQIDVHLHTFLINQVIDCYVNVQNWNEAARWAEFLEKVKVTQNGINLPKPWSNNNLTYLKCLSSFEESAVLYSKKDINSFKSDLTKNSEYFDISSWNMGEQFSKAQRLLMSVAMDYDNKNRSVENMQDVSEHIHDARDRILKLMKLSTLNWPPQMDPKQTGLFVSTSQFQSLKKAPSVLLRENIKIDPADCYGSTLGFLLTWENIWLGLNPGSPVKVQNGYFDLMMTSIRLSRKQQNFKMCFKLITNSLNYLSKANQNCEFSDLNLANCSDMAAVARSLKIMLKNTFNWNPNEKLLRTQREGAKLLRCLGDNEGSSDTLLNLVCLVSQHLKDSNQLQNYAVEQLSELNSRSMLNVVKYVQQDSKLACYVSPDNSSKESNWNLMLCNCVNDLKQPKEISGLNKNFIAELEQEKVVSDSDYLIGKLLQLSIHQCPLLAKSWYNFASWCYSWGRKVVNTSCVSMNMLPEEKAKITALVPNASKEDITLLVNAVLSLHSSTSGEWDSQEMDYSENSIVEMKFQLITLCPFLLKIENSEVIIDSVLEVWKNLARRAYSYYRMAAMSYLQYLQLNGKVSNRDRCEDDNVTATLRLLRLVVKHALELRDVLEEGLAETPTAPWRGIIPQLFSRLSHPEPYVRQSISDLLCRVAQAAPHLIVFPAVVGSLTLKVGPQLQEEAGLFRVYLPDSTEDAVESPVNGSQASNHEDLNPTDAILSDDDSEEDRQKSAVMQNCFTALVETLGSQDERTISEAKNLIHELHRITLLWDELWLGTLNLHQSEVNRRFSNLEKEICKVMSNTYLSKEEKKEIIKEKHNVYVKPTLFLLEQLQTITSQPAETPHEHWFQKTFEKHIENALNKLKNPSDPSRPQESWSVFKQLYQLLQQKVQQQSRSHLNMEHISPVLASLKSTVIPMPGINKPSGVVTIQSVHHVVSILPTKTKPKKLAFIGSDGHRYTYLFKGLEDLHLDERIMQFLSIVNNMFLKSKRHAKEVYYARHYSVTPLGPRSGLIQWVDGATPLFGLYKRWQQREANSVAVKGQTSTGNAGAVLRPSEIYYNKLTPLLKEKNLNCLDNRKEWPLSVMLEVLKQLMEETPDNLLAKELWCSCSSALEWWNVTQTYNHSTAVMSIIGYIIGLGDRHLDNVLVDLSTGEVVHIDYNVCFEKGKNLRVPEKVPFRMTPNIMTALGLTGIEGVFRTSCEHVLKVLRRGKETLLTLLEAFVYDPLVDWTPGNEGGYTGAVYGGRQTWATEAKQTRQSMELDIAFSMFAIRIAEMKGEWIKNRDELLAAFPKLEVLLQDWKKAQLNLQQTETELQDACQEKALLEEALLTPSHNLYTVPKRHDETTIVKTTVNATKEAVIEKLNECKKWHTVHCESLATVCGSELGKWCSDISNEQNADTLSVAPVVEFLQSAGQGQLVQQCEHAETELSSAVQQRQMTMRNCIDLLTTYATIVLQFGPVYKEQNRCFKWQKWLESLLSDFTSLKCIEILSDFRNHYGRESPDAIQSAISFNVQFQTVISDINAKVLSILERTRIENLSDKQALTAYAEETKCAVLQYLSDSGKPSHLAFLCVVGEALCTIRKQLFMMETAAAASGDRLVELASWKGDWFMDEIYSVCANATQYVQLLLDSCVVDCLELKSGLQGVKLANFVFCALEDLSLHFQNIILPEAIQTALEPSVIEMVAKLDRIIARCGVPLEKLISDLETNIANLILKTQIIESRVSDTVKKLRNEFESLMQRTEPQITGLNQGQMLLMGFNGLFTKIDSDLEILLSYLDNLQVPPSWQKLDMYRDTVALTPNIYQHAARPILRDIYFVKKLSAMQQSFHACHSFAASLQINPRGGIMERDILLVSEKELVKPVKQYTADYVRHLVLGLPSQTIGLALCLLISHMGYDLNAEMALRDVGMENISLEEILIKAYKSCISDNFLDAQLPSLSAVLSTFDSAWRKEDLARRLEQYLLVARGSQQRAQLQLARFQWLNEDLLVQGNIGPLPSSTVPPRSTVMSEIRKTVSALVTFDCVVTSAHERYLNLTSGIEQRLKWAAGANPSLTEVQEEFEAAIATKTATITNTNQLSRELANICNAILHFEALRTRTSEAVSSDNSFLSLINRCKETCELTESCQSQINPIEEHLISLKPLDKEGVTADWLTAVIKKVSQTLTACREKLEHQKSISTVCWESLHHQVVSVHDLISLHHKLMSEVRHILRNLAKHEELGLGLESKADGEIHRYMALYKDFSERISAIVSKLAEAKEMELGSLAAIESELPLLSVSAAEVYNQLLDLAGPLGNRKNGILEVAAIKPGSHSKRNLLCVTHDASVTLSPGVRPKTPLRYGTPKKLPITRDPRTGKAVQERNTYATNVWKRVKMKLDGRDPESNKKSSISEQVDYVIKEATNLENLAVLYEGWTPWV